MTTATQMNALADRFFRAIETTDLRTLDDCYTADAGVWHNWDATFQPRAANLAMLATFPQKFKSFAHAEVRRHFYDGGWVQQHVAHGILIDGRPFKVQVCMVIAVRDNKICRIDEYIDSRQHPSEDEAVLEK